MFATQLDFIRRIEGMKIKERLQIHREIEAENKRKLKKWKEGRK